MNSIFLYLVIHPVLAFAGWLLCGLVKNVYARIFLRSGVLAIAFTPTVVNMGTTDVPVSAIHALLRGLVAEPRPGTTIIIVWVVVFLIGLTLHLQKRRTPDAGD